MNLENLSKQQLAYILLGAGAFFFLASTGLFAFPNLLPLLLFGAGSAAFFQVFRRKRHENWWALIPSSALLALALATLAGPLSGSLFLGTLGLGFIAIYVSNNKQWWAIIPGGVLITLAFNAAPLFGIDEGIIFFLGITATFVTLYRLPKGRGRQTWARYPAIGTLIMSIMIAFSGFNSFGIFNNMFLSLGLLAAGGYLLWQHYRVDGAPIRPAPPAPPSPIQQEDNADVDPMPNVSNPNVTNNDTDANTGTAGNIN
jgi:hypothetical protein